MAQVSIHLVMPEDQAEQIRNRCFWKQQLLSQWIRDLILAEVAREAEEIFGHRGKFPPRSGPLLRGNWKREKRPRQPK